MVGKDARKLAAGIAEAPARVAGADGVAGNWEGNAQAVVASVPEGRELRTNARGLGWKANQGFEAFVMAPQSGGQTVTLGGLKLTVLCPLERQLEALRKEWERKLQALSAAGPAEVAEIAKSIDDSVYNLSSTVCLAELDGRRMLLTLHLTYRNCTNGVGKELAAFFAAEQKAGRTYEVNFRDEAAPSLLVHLLDAVNY